MKAERGRLGVLAAIVLAVSAFAFFAVAAATTKAHPVLQSEQFMLDVAGKPAHAAIWAWAQLWLGVWTLPFYLALHARLRHAHQTASRVALTSGVIWGVLLISITPVLFTVLHDIAPAWVRDPDAGSLRLGKALLAICATQITTVFFLRAISVLAAGIAMLAEGTARWLGWLGIVFSIEHVIAGVFHQTSGQGGVNSALGAVGGLMLTLWLLGSARWMSRESQTVAAGVSAPA